jgi:hypothetical protein
MELIARLEVVSVGHQKRGAWLMLPHRCLCDRLV